MNRRGRIVLVSILIIMLLVVIVINLTSSQDVVTSIIREDCTTYSGPNNCYESLFDWERLSQRDLTIVNGGEIEHVEIQGTWNNPDDTPVTIDGWTTDEEHYIRIYTTGAARHNGVWSDSAYRLSVDSGAGVYLLEVLEDYTIIDGLQIEITGTFSMGAVRIGAGGIQLLNNLIRENSAGATTTGIIFLVSGSGAGSYVYNNIIYDVDNGIIHSALDEISPVYSNTIVGCTTGIQGHFQSTLLLRNNLVDCTTAFSNSFHADSDYNAAGDSTNAGGSNDLMNQNFVFENQAIENFHLASGSDGINQGTDLSSDTYFSFNTDIDGDSREPGAWDIGADESGGVVCVPDCGSNVCGNNDGCGGPCGMCSGTTPDCVNGQCVPASSVDCDADDDGYDNNNATCSTPTNADCNDLNPSINPAAQEVCDNGVDEDCNPSNDVCSGGTLTGCNSNNPDLLLCDDFEYVVGRNDPNSVNNFLNLGGWDSVYTQQSSTRNHRGYLYTSNNLPGYNGQFPGQNSDNVLVIEALPTSLGNWSSTYWGDYQTNFYLKYGSGSSPTTTVPADVWFQFWVYPTGGFDGGKFIYPCNVEGTCPGVYPNNELHWLFYLNEGSGEPFNYEVLPDGTINTEQYAPRNELPTPHQFMGFAGWNASYSINTYNSGPSDNLGHTDTSELLISERWTKVKLHMNTSGSQGSYEAWLQPLGGEEVKVAEWIGGVTPDFTWDILNPSGHRLFMMPTTIGGVNVMTHPNESYDSITYMDDFAMARTEAALPTYGTTPPPTTSCPEGDITQDCECGETTYTDGYCINNIWFDPYYENINGGVFDESRFLYVDNSPGSGCSDSTSRALNSETSPWCTIGRAAWGQSTRPQYYPGTSSSIAAQPGDVIIIKEGIYSAPGTDENLAPQWSPVNSGNAGDKIIFKGVGLVDLRQDIGIGGSIIGCSMGIDHIIWDGFYINEVNMNSQVYIVAFFESDSCEIHHSEIVGGTRWDIAPSDNHDGVHVHTTNNTVIRNNILRGMRNRNTDSPNHPDRNPAQIKLYLSDYVLIEHNEFYDGDSGFYAKGGNIGPTIIRYNHFHDLDYGGIVSTGTMKGSIYQNIIESSPVGIYLLGIPFPNPTPANTIITNNNIINLSSYDEGSNPSSGISLTHIHHTENNSIWNNIIYGTNNLYALGFDSTFNIQDTNTSLTIDYLTNVNQLHPIADLEHNIVTFSGRALYSLGGPPDFNTLNEWKIASGQDSDIPTSFVGNPLFVDEANGDYRLSIGSPARGAGVDILNLQGLGVNAPINLGAYITGNEIIGVIDWTVSGTPQPCPNPHPADTNPSCCGVDSGELDAYINRWLADSTDVTIEQAASAIDAWSSGSC